MKSALLVAWREYAENAKTRGFWVGLFLFPLILFLSIQVPILLEQRATPVRYFILVGPLAKPGSGHRSSPREILPAADAGGPQGICPKE